MQFSLPNDGILEHLKQSGTVAAHLVTNFRDVLRVRHWIAHGRYWSQPLARCAMNDGIESSSGSSRTDR
jgi:hypothetical protein